MIQYRTGYYDIIPSVYRVIQYRTGSSARGVHSLSSVSEPGACDDGDEGTSRVALQAARPFDGTQLQDQLQLCHGRTSTQRYACILIISLQDH